MRIILRPYLLLRSSRADEIQRERRKKKKEKKNRRKMKNIVSDDVVLCRQSRALSSELINLRAFCFPPS